MLIRFLLLLVLIPREASAEPLPPLTQSDFSLDLFQGPVLGSTRVVGLGGAYAAVAEESVGIPFNPASVAHRTYYSRDRFDWDAGIDFLIPGLLQGDDFDYDNNTRPASTSSIAWSFGGMIQYKSFGVGAYARGQTYDLEQAGVAKGDFDFGLWLIQLSVGYAFFDHQLVVGGGPRLGLFAAQQKVPQNGRAQTVTLLQQQALGGEVGVLVRPSSWPVRFAAAFSSPLNSETTKECEDCPAGFVMPEGVALPWEVRLGASYRFSPRSFNPVPVFPEKKKKAKLPEQPPEALPALPVATPTPAPASQATPPPPASQPAVATEPPKPEEPDIDHDYRGGFYILVVVEVGLTGSVEQAIGSDAFFEQVREPAGESLSVSPRLGLESEVWRRRLRLRAGTYWEPSRFADASGRIHGTFAFDLRLFDFSLWGERSLRFSSAVDLASRYSNLLLSLGFWH
jgi:hypothetical protein